MKFNVPFFPEQGSEVAKQVDYLYYFLNAVSYVFGIAIFAATKKPGGSVEQRDREAELDPAATFQPTAAPNKVPISQVKAPAPAPMESMRAPPPSAERPVNRLKEAPVPNRPTAARTAPT